MKLDNINKKLFSINSRIRYRIPISRGSRVLVLAPHPDDETIGCAGTILSLKEREAEVKVVLFTKPNDKPNEELRLGEFNRVMKFLGSDSNIILGFPDGDLEKYFSEAKGRLDEIISQEKPDIIFTPYIFDYHKDHICVSQILSEVLNDKDIMVAMYEVWVPILHPDYYIDITDSWEKKRTALTYYKSQEDEYSIIEKAETLNHLRAELSMRKKVKHIETFKCFNGEEFHEIFKLSNEKYTIRGRREVNE